MPDTPDSARTATVVAFDYGLRRIGVAAGQAVTGSASPLGVVANRDTGPDWPAIERLIAEWQPSSLVVGLPLHADGSDSALTVSVRRFIAALHRFNLPVGAVDERYSSLEAQERLVAQRRRGARGRVPSGAVDAGSAVVIAERWLAAEPDAR